MAGPGRGGGAIRVRRARRHSPVAYEFGAVERGNALTLDRASLLPQLKAIAAGNSYAAFRRQREGVARSLVLGNSDFGTQVSPYRDPLIDYQQE